MDEKFKVVDENGIEKEAEVITAFNYKEKDYVPKKEHNLFFVTI